jgi:hypothetical protein
MGCRQSSRTQVWRYDAAVVNSVGDQWAVIRMHRFGFQDFVSSKKKELCLRLDYKIL